ncbi:(Fe-S)-binding protein [Pseudaeromonas sharmana]|uniref:(Fe-S)-binding protein n=1 Tax=Pseudaeromonas sharmana TaxID=328412 RepID=A0ABV8CKC1_9GAMM
MRHHLDWSNYHDQGMGDAYADIPRLGGDFAKAVAVCIRSGVCEQLTSSGVMCPSYRLTPGEDNSPGGRVRLLKAALNHPDPHHWLQEPRLAQAMASCVGCKGCQRECENSLDMAAIRVEYLAQKGGHFRKAWRRRLLSRFPLWLWRWPWLGRLIRWRNRHPFLAVLGQWLLGIAADVVLPEPVATRDLPQASEPPGTGVPVLLWVDAFTALFDPQQVAQARRLLRQLGYAVHVLAPASGGRGFLDCGRAAYAQGEVALARRQLGQLLQALQPALVAGWPIIGLEPSALLMLRDESRQLCPEQAPALRSRARLLEEFLAHELQAGNIALPLSALARPLLVHGHCHQKAAGAMKSLRRLLRQIPALQVEFIEAACCGMAGTHGIESEHAAAGEAMARQVLIPVIESRPDAELLCTGMACRHQITRLTGRQPLTLVGLLARLYAGSD